MSRLEWNSDSEEEETTPKPKKKVVVLPKKKPSPIKSVIDSSMEPSKPKSSKPVRLEWTNDMDDDFLFREVESKRPPKRQKTNDTITPAPKKTTSTPKKPKQTPTAPVSFTFNDSGWISKNKKTIRIPRTNYRMPEPLDADDIRIFGPDPDFDLPLKDVGN